MQLLPGSNKRASLLPNEVRLSHGKKLGYPSSSTMRNGTCAQSSILIFSLGNETSTLQRSGAGSHVTVQSALCGRLHPAKPASSSEKQDHSRLPWPTETCRSESTKRLLKPPTPKRWSQMRSRALFTLLFLTWQKFRVKILSHGLENRSSSPVKLWMTVILANTLTAVSQETLNPSHLAKPWLPDP